MRGLALTLLLLLGCQLLLAQSDRKMPLGRGAELYPYPFANMYYVSPRYDRVVYSDNGFFDTYYIRNVATFNGNAHLRFDVPVVSTNLTDNGSTLWGLGDLNLRYTRVFGNIKEVFYGAHCNMVMPTATNSALGGGKWQMQVGAGAMYFIKESKGTVSFTAEYRFSFAGKQDRADVRQVAISPNVDYWGKNWYAGYYATWVYDFESSVFDLPLDVEVGYNIIPSLIVAAEFKLPLVNDVSYRYEFAVKLRYNILSY